MEFVKGTRKFRGPTAPLLKDTRKFGGPMAPFLSKVCGLCYPASLPRAGRPKLINN